MTRTRGAPQQRSDELERVLAAVLIGGRRSAGGLRVGCGGIGPLTAPAHHLAVAAANLPTLHSPYWLAVPSRAEPWCAVPYRRMSCPVS